MKLDIAQLEAEAQADADDREPFEIETRDGVTIQLPHSDELTLEQVEQFDETKPLEALRILVGDDAYQEFRTVPLPVLNRIIGEWLPWSGLGTVGEGDASPRSLTGSARPSKRTSRAGTRRSA